MMSLSFSEEFFTGSGDVDVYDIAPSDAPTSVLQAIISLDRETQIDIARDVLGSDCPGLYVDSESFPFDVLDKIRETDACDDCTPPVRVYVDEEGFYSVDVHEEDARDDWSKALDRYEADRHYGDGRYGD
jgi:hypothetical protein